MKNVISRPRRDPGHTSSALPTLPEADITNMAISGDGRDLAFSAGGCAGCPLEQPGRIGVTNLDTRRTRQWTVPREDQIVSVSIDANGITSDPS